MDADPDLLAGLIARLALDGRTERTSRSGGKKLKEKRQAEVPPEQKPTHCVTCLEEFAGLDALNEHLALECIEAVANTIKHKAKKATTALQQLQVRVDAGETLSEEDQRSFERAKYNKILAIFRVNALERRHAGGRRRSSSSSAASHSTSPDSFVHVETP